MQPAQQASAAVRQKNVVLGERKAERKAEGAHVGAASSRHECFMQTAAFFLPNRRTAGKCVKTRTKEQKSGVRKRKPHAAAANAAAAFFAFAAFPEPEPSAAVSMRTANRR